MYQVDIRQQAERSVTKLHISTIGNKHRACVTHPAALYELWRVFTYPGTELGVEVFFHLIATCLFPTMYQKTCQSVGCTLASVVATTMIHEYKICCK